MFERIQKESKNGAKIRDSYFQIIKKEYEAYESKKLTRELLGVRN